jgi:hypothetical protein
MSYPIIYIISKFTMDNSNEPEVYNYHNIIKFIRLR